MVPERTPRPAKRHTGAAKRPSGVLADVPSLQPAALIEPLWRMVELVRVLNCSRREVERLRSSGRLPAPDLHIGKMPRWRPETILQWIEEGGRP